MADSAAILGTLLASQQVTASNEQRVAGARLFEQVCPVQCHSSDAAIAAACWALDCL
jgi:mono/diheme cytochrome c family protein